jgi:hypothetical protein
MSIITSTVEQDADPAKTVLLQDRHPALLRGLQY